MTEKQINGKESHPEREDVYEVQAEWSKKQPTEPMQQQTGMRWPSVVALFIICATVVALCWITRAENFWN